MIRLVIGLKAMQSSQGACGVAAPMNAEGEAPVPYGMGYVSFFVEQDSFLEVDVYIHQVIGNVSGNGLLRLLCNRMKDFKIVLKR